MQFNIYPKRHYAILITRRSFISNTKEKNIPKINILWYNYENQEAEKCENYFNKNITERYKLLYENIFCKTRSNGSKS